MNADHKSLEKVFSIAICRQSDNKRQSKTLFLTVLDLRSSIVITFYIAAYLKCLLNIALLKTRQNQSETMATRNNLQSGDKRQSKTLLLTILDLRSSVVLTFSIAAYLKCLLNIGLLNTYSQNNPKQGLLGIIYIFHGSVEKNNFVSTPDIRQSKTS